MGCKFPPPQKSALLGLAFETTWKRPSVCQPCQPHREFSYSCYSSGWLLSRAIHHWIDTLLDQKSSISLCGHTEEKVRCHLNNYWFDCSVILHLQGPTTSNFLAWPHLPTLLACWQWPRLVLWSGTSQASLVSLKLIIHKQTRGFRRIPSVWSPTEACPDGWHVHVTASDYRWGLFQLQHVKLCQWSQQLSPCLSMTAWNRVLVSHRLKTGAIWVLVSYTCLRKRK